MARFRHCFEESVCVKIMKSNLGVTSQRRVLWFLIVRNTFEFSDMSNISPIMINKAITGAVGNVH